MNNNTTNRLNNLSNILVEAIVLDYARGNVDRKSCGEIHDKDNVVTMKNALRHDRRLVESNLPEMKNVFKTSSQLTYLSNEIVTKLRSKARRDKLVRDLVKTMFNR